MDRAGRVARYTRIVARWVRSVASLITVLTLAGTPALLSACVALCPVMEADAAGSAGPTGHGDHAMPADDAEPMGGHHTAATALPDAPNVTGTGHHCCQDGLASSVTPVTAGRAATQVVDASAVAARAWWVHTVVTAPVPLRERLARPPDPPSAAAVLRI